MPCPECDKERMTIPPGGEQMRPDVRGGEPVVAVVPMPRIIQDLGRPLLHTSFGGVPVLARDPAQEARDFVKNATQAEKDAAIEACWKVFDKLVGAATEALAKCLDAEQPNNHPAHEGNSGTNSCHEAYAKANARAREVLEANLKLWGGDPNKRPGQGGGAKK